MSVSVRPAESSAGRGAVSGGAPHAALRPVLLALAATALLVTLVVLAYQVAAARVPQHRAALEELLRHESGLDVSFGELSVRFGWYGPEAVFHNVRLAEAGGDTILTAPRLAVGLDLWRMARSGQLTAGRITLDTPDIDLGAITAPLAPHAGAAGGARARPNLMTSGTRLLSRWRGGQLDVAGGTLRLASAGALPLTVAIRSAQLMRSGATWRANALVMLPESLGAGARLALEWHGDPALPEVSSGSVSFDGRRLEFAGWAQLLGAAAAGRYLPRSGTGNLALHADFAHGRVVRADGTVHAQSLSWGARAAGAPLALERLNGQWQLAHARGAWHLRIGSLELGPDAAQRATLNVDASGDGAWLRGRLEQAPLAALLALLRSAAPQLPLDTFALDGRARVVTFDWNRERSEGERLMTSALLTDVTLASAARAVAVSGLTVHLAGRDDQLVADVESPAAQLTLARAEAVTQDQIALASRLTLGATAQGWRLSTEELRVHHAGMTLTASGALAGAPGAPTLIDGRVSAQDADITLLTQLFTSEARERLGLAGRLTAGTITSAAFNWHGPLAAPPGADDVRFAGGLQLAHASLPAGAQWPAVDDIAARIDWRGAHAHAAIERATSGSFTLTSATADWQTGTAQPLRFAGRLAGNAADALAWLKRAPQLSSWAPGLANIDLSGNTLIDLEVRADARAAAPHVRVGALLDGAQLRPVAGLPPLDALRGTLAFSAGHLQHSTLTGHWLGGPVTLTVGERREHGVTQLVLSGRGVMAARESVQAAGGDGDSAPLSGSAEWSALLTLVPGARWQLRADSSLAGVASALPEPFAKSAASALPLHVELSGAGGTGQLQLNLGERLRAVAALERSGDSWRIERGALRVAGAVPQLPAQPLLDVDGRIGALDLPAYLAFVRQVSRDAALPPLSARLHAERLSAGSRNFTGVSIATQTLDGAGALQLQSQEISGSLHWPAPGATDQSGSVHLAAFDLAQPADLALAAGLAALLAPQAQLSVDELRWQGRALGSVSARLTADADSIAVGALRLTGLAGDGQGDARCTQRDCEAAFVFDSRDAAATLSAFGLRPEVAAARARLEGRLRWPAVAAEPLASLSGHLHMQLEDGTTRAADLNGEPFALLCVPALLASLNAGAPEAPQLQFKRLAADFELADGEARTTDLHFDGDAEILMRGRVGLTASDYDQEAWILRGEDRLPAAVRRLDPTPRIAAAWLSLREMFAGLPAERARTALRLRGSWNDPIVAPAQ
jgi:uncharacterized protein YhdP